MANTGFVGFNWSTRPLISIGLTGFNFSLKNYLIIRVIDPAGDFENLSVSIVSGASTINTSTDQNGYAFVSNREFEQAVITVSDDERSSEVTYDSSIQTNQYVEVSLLVTQKNFTDNRFNFVRWYQGASTYILGGSVGASTDDGQTIQEISIDCCYPQNQIPSATRIHREHEISYFNGDDYCWIMNFEAFFGDASDSNIKVGLVNSQWSLVTQLGTIQKSGSSYYFEFTLNLSSQVYGGRFILYDDTTNVVYYFSNRFKFLRSNGKNRFPYFKLRHSSDLYGYKFKTDLQNVFLKYRLHFQMRYQDPIINLTQVKELTTGRTRNQLALADQLVVLRGKQFDRNSHEAMIPVSLMDNQEINSKKYVIRTPWKWQGNEIKSLNDGVIEYTDEEASTINVGG